MRLLLARHGQSRANVAGILQGQVGGELTPLGRAQAAALAERVAREGPARIVSSDLRRAADTALATAERVARPLELEEALREWHVGEFDGADPSTLVEAARRSGLPFDEFRPAGGESRRELEARAGAVARGLVPGLEDAGVALVVSHGDLLRALVSHLLVGDARLAPRIVLDNASLTALVRRGRTWDLERLNDTAHLEDVRRGATDGPLTTRTPIHASTTEDVP